MTIRLIFLLLFSTQAHAWGEPASATTTVRANITHWTEDPCDFPEHQDKCKMKDDYDYVPVIQAPAATRFSVSEPDRIEHTPYVMDTINYE